MKKSVLTMILLLMALPAFAAPRLNVPTMDVSEIEPDMEGYLLTVVQGTEPIKVPVRIIGVLRKINAGGDMILARLVGEEYEHMGTAGGMSGSPVYIEGKLVGALAWGWSFSKDPLFGATPIADMARMLDEEDAPPRAAGRHLPPGVDTTVTFGDPFAAARYDLALKDFLDAADGAAPYNTLSFEHPLLGAGQMAPVATPVTVSGLNLRTQRFLRQVLERKTSGPVLMSGGGSSSGISNPKPDPAFDDLVPGAAITIPLMIGDMEATVMGTVTYRDGDTILAFGHPVLGAGPVDLPIGGGEVHHVRASLANSGKMGDPTGIVGAMVSDKNFAGKCIVGKESTMIPAHFTVRDLDNDREQITNVYVTPREDLVASLLYSALYNTVAQLTGDMGEASAKVDMELRIKGRKRPISLRNMYFSTDLFFIGALEHLTSLIYNPFERIELESVDVVFEIERARRVAFLSGMSIDRDRLHPGDSFTVNVELRRFDGSKELFPINMQLPQDAKPGMYRIGAVSGVDRGPMTEALPENLDQYVDALEKWAPNNSLVMILAYPDKAPVVGGYELMHLPSTMRDTVLHGNFSGMEPIDKQERLFVPMDDIIIGTDMLPIIVEPDTR